MQRYKQISKYPHFIWKNWYFFAIIPHSQTKYHIYFVTSSFSRSRQSDVALRSTRKSFYVPSPCHLCNRLLSPMLPRPYKRSMSEARAKVERSYTGPTPDFRSPSTDPAHPTAPAQRLAKRQNSTSSDYQPHNAHNSRIAKPTCYSVTVLQFKKCFSTTITTETENQTVTL